MVWRDSGRQFKPWSAIDTCYAVGNSAFAKQVTCSSTRPPTCLSLAQWFRDYKMPDGKPANAYGYDSKCMDKAFTMKVGGYC